MARKYVYLGYKWHTYYGYTLQNQWDYWLDWRDRLRNGFDPGETHNKCLVTDICRFQRYSDGNRYGYCFLIKAMEAGEPTGPCWMINANTGENGVAYTDWDLYWWESTDGIDSYYESFLVDYLEDYQPSVLSIHYHPTAGLGLMSFTGTTTGSPGIGSVAADDSVVPTRYGKIYDVQDGGATWVIQMTNGPNFEDGPGKIIYADGQQLTDYTTNYNHSWNFGFTDHNNGMLGGTINFPSQQDFVAPPYPPNGSSSYTPPQTIYDTQGYQNFRRFAIWPHQEMIKGVVQICGGGTPHMMAIYDEDKPFLSWYGSADLNPSIYSIYLSGNIITPYIPTDTYTHGAVWIRLNYGGTSNPGEVTRWRFKGWQLDGTPTNWTRYIHSFINYANNPREQDFTYPWFPVILANSNEFKGQFDTDIIRIMGQPDQYTNQFFDGPDGPFVKYGQYMVFPWVNSTPLFPPFRWDLAYPWND